MNEHLPEMESLGRIQWQFFGSLTFKDARLREHLEGKPDRIRKMKFCAWGRKIGDEMCWRYQVRGHAVTGGWFEEYCINAVRLEPGEVSGLWHYHFLMAGFPKSGVNRSTCAAMEAWWRKLGGGHPKIHVFDSTLNGEEYVTKCLNLGDEHESRKFGGAVHLMLSPAFYKVMKNEERDITKARRLAMKEETRRIAGTGSSQHPQSYAAVTAGVGTTVP